MTSGLAILQAFHQADGQFVPVADLRRHVPDLTHEIADLESCGYQFEAHPQLGYRLLGIPDRLMSDDIRARYQARLIGTEILVFEQTASTNDVVAYLANSGAREGLVVFAEHQTKGRGRHGRVWVSPRGKGLWFSILLRPKLPATALQRLTVAASVAVARALRKVAGVDALIKWPNDVTIAGKKVAGVLTELQGDAAILGIGIDVNCLPDELPAEVATSLRIATGRDHDRAALAAEVLRALDETYRQALTDFDALIAVWAQWSTTLGKQIVIKMHDRKIAGFAQALDADGALLLRRDNGQIERVLGADLTVERA